MISCSILDNFDLEEAVKLNNDEKIGKEIETYYSNWSDDENNLINLAINQI